MSSVDRSLDRVDQGKTTTLIQQKRTTSHWSGRKIALVTGGALLATAAIVAGVALTVLTGGIFPFALIAAVGAVGLLAVGGYALYTHFKGRNEKAEEPAPALITPYADVTKLPLKKQFELMEDYLKNRTEEQIDSDFRCDKDILKNQPHYLFWHYSDIIGYVERYGFTLKEIYANKSKWEEILTSIIDQTDVTKLSAEKQLELMEEYLGNHTPDQIISDFSEPVEKNQPHYLFLHHQLIDDASYMPQIQTIYLNEYQTEWKKIRERISGSRQQV